MPLLKQIAATVPLSWCQPSRRIDGVGALPCTYLLIAGLACKTVHSLVTSLRTVAGGHSASAG
jgi:hypothetical protein